MNKGVKIFLAVMGAINTVFAMFIPISVVFFWITLGNLSTFQIVLVSVLGILSTLYRAISVGFIKRWQMNMMNTE